MKAISNFINLGANKPCCDKQSVRLLIFTFFSLSFRVETFTWTKTVTVREISPMTYSMCKMNDPLLTTQTNEVLVNLLKPSGVLSNKAF